MLTETVINIMPHSTNAITLLPFTDLCEGFPVGTLWAKLFRNQRRILFPALPAGTLCTIDGFHNSENVENRNKNGISVKYNVAEGLFVEISGARGEG